MNENGWRPAAAELRAAAAEIDRGRFAEARERLERALDSGADAAEVHLGLGLAQLGLAQRGQGALEDAAECFELAVHHRPGFAAAWLRLSAVRLHQARFTDAEQAAQSAIACGQDSADAHNNLGLALRGLGRFDDAERAFRGALRIDPGHADARANLGIVLKDLGRIADAIECMEDFLKDHPADDDVLWYLSVMRLAAGDFAGGWRDYEKRWLQRDSVKRNFDFSVWDGSSLDGRTILVYAEQGLGDEIMFASCIPDLLRSGGSCVVECSPRLAQLFRRSFAQAEVICANADSGRDWRARLPRIDCQIAAGSLPGVLGRDWPNFPPHAGYLRADPARIAWWRGVLGRLGPGPKIGLSWRGGAMRTGRAMRSLEVPCLAPLSRLHGCRFVSLQYGEVSADLAAMRRELGLDVAHWQEAIDDLDEMAALACALDQIVTVTTMLVHLCGALGRTVSVMVPASPEWRYLLRGERMPWYPGVRLFRQPIPHDWLPVVDAVTRELEEQLSGSRVAG